MSTICPYLPPPHEDMSYQDLRQHGTQRGEAFYVSALQYGHFLWLQGHAGRALLAIARGLYSAVLPHDPVLLTWPLPYAAIQWIVRQHDHDDFPGNPLLSFHHQAYRMPAPRQWQRCARAWAVWSMIRQTRPSLSCDPALPLPSDVEIYLLLQQFGHPGEATLWARTMALMPPASLALPAARLTTTYFNIAPIDKGT